MSKKTEAAALYNNIGAQTLNESITPEMVNAAGQKTLEAVEEEFGKCQLKADGKGLSTNDYDNLAVSEVEKIVDKQDSLTGGKTITYWQVDEPLNPTGYGKIWYNPGDGGEVLPYMKRWLNTYWQDYGGQIDNPVNTRVVYRYLSDTYIFTGDTMLLISQTSNRLHYETLEFSDYSVFDTITLENGLYNLEGAYLIVINDVLEDVKIGVLQEFHLADNSIQLRYITITEGVPTYPTWKTIPIITDGILSVKNLMSGNTNYSTLDTLTSPGFYRVPDHAVTGTNETRSPVFVSQYKKLNNATVYTSQQLITKNGEVFSRNNEPGGWTNWESNFKNNLDNNNQSGYALDSRQGHALKNLITTKQNTRMARASAPWGNQDTGSPYATKAQLEEALMYGISMEQVYLDGCNFSNAVFTNLKGGDLGGGTFSNCNFSGAGFISSVNLSFQSCDFSGASLTSCSGLNIDGGYFVNTSILSSNLSYISLMWLSFVNLYCQDTDFSGTTFESSSFTYPQGGAMVDSFLGCKLQDTSFIYCTVPNSNINICLDGTVTLQSLWISCTWIDGNNYTFNQDTSLWVQV